MSDIITNTTSTNKSKVFNVYVSKSTTAGTALVTRGSLNKTDTAPTVAGLYILEETGIYPNLGNIDAQAGKLNFASFDGTTWSLIAVDMPQYLSFDTINSYIRTGEPNYVYNDSTFIGWASFKHVQNINEIRYVNIRKRGGSSSSMGIFTVKIWGSNTLNSLSNELASFDIQANDFVVLNDGESFLIDFGQLYNISSYQYVSISIEGTEMPPIQQAQGDSIEGKGFYKINGSNSWLQTVDTIGYGLWWEASPLSTFEQIYKIKEKNIPENIITAVDDVAKLKSHNLIKEIRQLADFQKINPIRNIILSQDSDVYLTLYGDSITAWQSTFLKPSEGVTEVPPVCDRQGFAYRLYKSVGFGSPIYRRFDYGKASLVSHWDDKWTDDSQAFFNEVGAFKTYQYGGIGRPSNIYDVPQFTTEIADEICPISAFDSATTYRDIPKRCSNAANASVSFKIPSGFLKGDFIFHAINDGDNVTISVSGGNGKLRMHTKQNDWANAEEANSCVFSTAKPIYVGFNDASGIPCRRIFFKKENINEEITITITKSSNTAKWMCYWGATYWGISGRENALHISTMGRGSRRFDELNTTKSSDILGVHTDICVMENTLINSMGDRNQVLNFRNQYDILDAFFASNNIPVLYVSPHMTTINSNDSNYENSKAFHNGVRGYEESKGSVVFGVQNLIEKTYETYYKSEFSTLSDFLKTLMFDTTTHPNEKGFDFYQVLCESIIN